MAENPNQGHRGKSQTSGASSIVRLAGRDVDGSLNIERSLSKVKGIGQNLAHSLAITIEAKLNIPKSTEVGTLSESQVEDVEKIIKDPEGSGIPWYGINRNKDAETGKDIHVVSSELIFNTRQDVSRDISNKTWRGHRHQYGQKVRGQHTRSTGRTGATIGVTKKAMQQAAKGASATKPAAGKEAVKK
ncbi:MAG: 30S ribosomal protein S13 [Candidatus Micrarchaeaceae archaeon]|jgi:small subunit ribosomal protein S13